MANKILLQTLLRFSDQIKSGAAKVQDVITDYFNTTGKSVTDEERGIILKEFQDNAPSNVTTLEGVDPRETIMSTYKSAADDMTDVEKDDVLNTFLEQSDRVYANFVNKALVDLQNASKSEQQQMVKAIIGRKGMFKYLDDADAKKLLNSVDNPGAGTGEVVGLRGDETFDELIQTKETDQGIGSLFKKDIDGFDDRGEAATFIKAMRDAGIKNEDIRKVFKDNPPYRKSSSFYGQDKNKMILDLEPGKKAATTLARAADMAADTKIKQELLANLDDDIANYGPDWWKGMGYNEGPMGRESVGNLLESITTDINNGVIDDLIAAGMEEDKAFEIMRYMGRDVRERLKFDPKGFIRKVAEELEFNDIKYDMTFWDNYVNEILTRIQKPAPRFADGGLV